MVTRTEGIRNSMPGVHNQALSTGYVVKAILISSGNLSALCRHFQLSFCGTFHNIISLTGSN